MPGYEKFDVTKLERLNDPGRLETLSPDVMWDALRAPDPAVIVEIGAGTGVFAAAFAERAPHATVYAVDTEPIMLEWMMAHRAEVATGRVVPVQGTATTVPLPDGMADVVAMVNLHHELQHPKAIYSEAYRLLKPGGRVLVVDWAPKETPRGPALVVRATPGELRAALHAACFSDVTVSEDALPWHTVVVAVKSVEA